MPSTTPFAKIFSPITRITYVVIQRQPALLAIKAVQQSSQIVALVAIVPFSLGLRRCLDEVCDPPNKHQTVNALRKSYASAFVRVLELCNLKDTWVDPENPTPIHPRRASGKDGARR